MSLYLEVRPANYLVVVGDSSTPSNDVEGELQDVRRPFHQLKNGRAWVIRHDAVKSIVDDARFTTHVHVASLTRDEQPLCTRNCYVDVGKMFLDNLAPNEREALIEAI